MTLCGRTTRASRLFDRSARSVAKKAHDLQEAFQMKKICIVISLLLLSSIALAGESPDDGSLPEEDVLTSTEAEATQREDTETEGPNDDALVLEALGGCNATADCWDGSTVSCSISSGGSGSCDFADSSCPWEHGWATCGWDEDHCPPCPCPDPAPRCIENRSCTEPCGSECGPGTCINGSCNCLI